MNLNRAHSQRLFIAVEPSIELKPLLKELTEKLQVSAIKGFKVISPDMIHLTLKFLGNVPEQQIQSLKDNMSSLIFCEPFCLEFTQIGVFPNIWNPRTVWLGLERESPKLNELKNVIEQHVTPAGRFKNRHHFVPHLTLARCAATLEPKEMRRVQIALQGQLSNCQRNLRVESVSLMRSILDPGGAVYSRIHSQNFGLATET